MAWPTLRRAARRLLAAVVVAWMPAAAPGQDAGPGAGAASFEIRSPDDLRALALPVTLVYGKQSPCRPVANTLRKLLPIRALLLIDCGHYIPSEAPEPLRDVVVGTLRYETAEESLQEKPVADAVQVSA